MSTYSVTFIPHNKSVRVEADASLLEAALRAQHPLNQPLGIDGRPTVHDQPHLGAGLYGPVQGIDDTLVAVDAVPLLRKAHYGSLSPVVLHQRLVGSEHDHRVPGPRGVHHVLGSTTEILPPECGIVVQGHQVCQGPGKDCGQ